MKKALDYYMFYFSFYIYSIFIYCFLDIVILTFFIKIILFNRIFKNSL